MTAFRKVSSPVYVAPSSENLVTGTLSAGSYADLAAVGGTTVNISEVTGVPGFDYRLTFSGIAKLGSYSIKGYYDGSAAHEKRIEIYNNTTTAWDTLQIVEHDTQSLWNWWSGDIEEEDYLSSGNAIIRFYHYTSGVGTHDLYLDYASIRSYIEQE